MEQEKNKLNDVIREYLYDNPKLLNANYDDTASKFNVTRERVRHICRAIRKKIKKDLSIDNRNDINNKNFTVEKEVIINNETGTLTSNIMLDFEPKNDMEVAEQHKVDLEKYTIVEYYSVRSFSGKFRHTLKCKLKPLNSPEVFQQSFLDFLKAYKPKSEIVRKNKSSKKTNVCLVIPKQDAHYDKFDIGGDNCIDKRFKKSFDAIDNSLIKSTALNNLEEVIYIVGSDQFNSEWTNMTTKGTPQQNMMSYQSSFMAICDHEISVINNILNYSDRTKVIFVPGNHDEFVGWHLVNWLESYYRNNKNVEFDTDTVNTKYHKYNNSAVMLNHGDSLKAKDLAHIFPIGFKENWSKCDHYYIMTGDKHHEMSIDVHGIKFYQVPALSNSKSKWDDKNGYTSTKAEMTCFVISADNGMTDIYKEIL